MNNISSLFIKSLNFNLPQYVAMQQVRTTYILKRRYAPKLLKKGPDTRRRMGKKYFIYDLVKDTNIEKKPEIPLILTEFVKNYGNPGEKVFVSPVKAYEKFLLPQLAVYATPENELKYKSNEKFQKVCSSPSAQITATKLSMYRLVVNMNDQNEWTLKPWHIKTSLRRAGIHVPEENIEVPRSITGPNTDYENKEFYVIVTINNFEKVKLRCQLKHCATNILNPLIKDSDDSSIIVEPIFPEDAEVLNTMPPVDTELNFTF